MRPNNCIIMNNLSAASNQTSTVQWTDTIVRVSFQVVNSGTSTGTLQLQASDDQAIGLPANQFTPTNWFNVGGTVSVTGAGVFVVTQQEVAYEYLKLVFTSSVPGTGTLLARMKSFSL
jgi:hypothetical protein